MTKISEGQSILEVVFATAVIVLIIVGIVSLASNSISDAIFSRSQTLATKYAQEAMEWLRGQKDKDWEEFFLHATYGGTLYCINSLSWGTPGRCDSDTYIEETNLSREMTLELVDESGSEVEAVVTVFWTNSQGTHEVKSTTRFTDWRN